MAYHFISILGTGVYEPVRYCFEGNPGSRQEYIQLALIEKYREKLQEDGAKITVFLTPDAKKKNWEARTVDERMQGIMGKRKQIPLPAIGDTIDGMAAQLDKQFPELSSRISTQLIVNPNTADDIWALFNSIYDVLNEGDQIIFDITHSFRSIPMLAMTVINYAKVLKNCILEGIFYGAYEAASEMPEQGKVAPIIDLTMYNEILEWTNAANVFMRLGNASLMKEIYGQQKKTLDKKMIKELKTIEDIVSAAEILSNAIQTSRGVGIQNLPGKKNLKDYSIQAAAQNYESKCSQRPEDEVKRLSPIYKLLDKTQESFACLNQEENYQTGIQTVHWCIKHGMVQQGYTALEETILTYLCKRYGLSENDFGVSFLYNSKCRRK